MGLFHIWALTPRPEFSHFLSGHYFGQALARPSHYPQSGAAERGSQGAVALPSRFLLSIKGKQHGERSGWGQSLGGRGGVRMGGRGLGGMGDVGAAPWGKGARGGHGSGAGGPPTFREFPSLLLTMGTAPSMHQAPRMESLQQKAVNFISQHATGTYKRGLPAANTLHVSSRPVPSPPPPHAPVYSELQENLAGTHAPGTEVDRNSEMAVTLNRVLLAKVYN